MARVLIAEPHDEIAELYSHLVGSLGHQTIRHVPGSTHAGIDVLIVEPAHRDARDLVESLLAIDPDLPVVAVSIYPRSELPAFPWADFHQKPVPLAQLRDSLVGGLARVVA